MIPNGIENCEIQLISPLTYETKINLHDWREAAYLIHISTSGIIHDEFDEI